MIEENQSMAITCAGASERDWGGFVVRPENSQDVRYHADAPHVRRRAQRVVIDDLGSCKRKQTHER